ncbi:MAG: cyclic nucleotide-binding domain-containing protein [Gammaproteobacteria bacterium]|nr:cyclic nucleotide-binding domain-containing protein [Gammaproteobacteria bacterium]
MEKKRSRLELVRSRQSPDHCSARRFCLAGSVDRASLQALEAEIRSRGPYQQGERIYRQGDSFRALYMIQSGAVKTEINTRDGRAQVSGFHLQGELLGVETLGGGRHPCDAVALERTWCCTVPVERFLRVCNASGGLQNELLQRLGQRIRDDEYGWMLNRNERAEVRLVCFLYDLYRRMSQRSGESSGRMRLPMRKEDIASYLGLAPESLSRTFRHLRNEGIIANQGSAVELLDVEAAAAIASH